MRLQFWVNLLLKHLYGEKKLKPEDVETYMNRYAVKKIVKVLGFILHMRDVVLEIYDNSRDHVPEFEWNKHVRMVLDGETQHCIVECGG